MAANRPSSLQCEEMKQYLRLPVIAVACAGLGAGAVTAYRLAAQPSCRAGAAPYARLELLFGLGRQRGGEISEEEWRAFLEKEVTPRFPAGLTVFAAYGQWRSPSGLMIKEPSRVLVVWYRPEAATEVAIEAIRAAYKLQFGQESVLRVDGASCVAF
jgi:Protein of unknown function (DUF3574)